VVTLYDDHDQVRKGMHKARFCAGDSAWRKLAINAMALNVTTLGIPCIYYGSEQGFDGEGDNDRYIRETMFGGEFGAFHSRGRHFFDEGNPIYRELSSILALRREKIALRRGRQYLREISGDGQHFGLPRVIGDRIRSLVPWSRLFDDQHLVVAINTDPDNPGSAWVDLEPDPNPAGSCLACLYSSDPAQVGQELEVQAIGVRRAVRLEVPEAGFVVYE